MYDLPLTKMNNLSGLMSGTSLNNNDASKLLLSLNSSNNTPKPQDLTLSGIIAQGNLNPAMKNTKKINQAMRGTGLTYSTNIPKFVTNSQPSISDPLKYTMDLIAKTKAQSGQQPLNSTAPISFNDSMGTTDMLTDPSGGDYTDMSSTGNNGFNNYSGDDMNTRGLDGSSTQDYGSSSTNNGYAVDNYGNSVVSGTRGTLSELITDADKLNNIRNAIYSGTIDPFNLGVKSGIPFTADQLRGIEQGIARSIDPAISDLKGRIIARQKKDENNSSNEMAYNFGSNPAIDVILGSGKFTKDQKNLIIQSIQSGSDPKTIIFNQAKNLMNGPEATNVTKSEQALASMQDLDSLLKQYYANGGKTSLLSGTYENVLNKLGTLKDPNLVGVGVGIATALQKYRNAVSGTAFSVQEGREMKSVFPSITNNQGLNDAITKARINSLKNEVDSAYRLVLGSAYDSLVVDNSSVSQGITEQDNQILQYRILSDGNVEVFSKVGGDTNTATNRPTRNNNPLNIKASETTIKYPGVASLDKSPASDGGQFLVFRTPQDGFNAAARLITSKNYINLPVDSALRRWSNNGYGSEIIPQLRGRTIASLTQNEIQALVKTMAKREGFNA